MGLKKGKVFIVTGGNQGVGFELCKMLRGTGATVYIASRSKVSSCRGRLSPWIFFSQSLGDAIADPVIIATSRHSHRDTQVHEAQARAPSRL